MDQEFRFISVRQVGWPLILLAIVILGTAQATGGIGLRSMGGAVYGGKKYMTMFVAIMGYFALTAQRIPRERANLYIGLFFLGGITNLIGDVLYFQNPALRYLFMFFPPTWGLLGGGTADLAGGAIRFSGLSTSCLVVAYFMLARFGIRGLFSALRPWRLALLIALLALSMMGGYRSYLLAFVFVFCIQFYLEGLHRTRLLPIVLLGLVLIASVTLPFSRQLPLSVQRTLSVLPIPVDMGVRANAEESSEWRLRMWEALLPAVPKYLLLGKGLALAR